MLLNTTDLIGYNNGKLIVNGFSRQEIRGGRKRALWNVTCLFCGKEFEQTRDSITLGKGAPCGCYRRIVGQKVGKLNHIDLTNQTVGEWFVESRAEDYIHKSGVHAVRYNCICSCGIRKVVLASSLINGESKSCGHSRQEMIADLLRKDLTGKQVNLLHVDYLIPGSHPPKYHCTCTCGVEKDVLGQTLLNNAIVSCGHASATRGELAIKAILEKHNVKFKYNCTLKELTSYCQRKLRLDFQIFDYTNKLICAIEYQGEQHYKEVKIYNDNFGKQQREITDPIKREFFKKIKLPLYEIPYNKDVEELTYAILYKHHLIHDNTVPSLQETA